MKRSLIYIGVYLIVTAILIYQVTSPVQSDFVITNYLKDSNTIVSFNVPVKSVVRLTVYDAEGIVISTLMNKELEAGSYEAEVVFPETGEGIYFCKLSANEQVNVSETVFRRTSKDNITSR